MPVNNLPARKQSTLLFIFAILSAVEFLIAGSMVLQIEADPKNAFLFGYSILRILLFLVNLVFCGFFLSLGILIRQKKLSFDSFQAISRRPLLAQAAAFFLFAALLWGWLSLFSSSYLYGQWIYAFERLRPFSTALGLSAFQIILAWVLSFGNLRSFRSILKQNRPLLLSFALFLIVILGTVLLISLTGLGLKPDAMFFNVPGMPLSGAQFFPLLVFLALAVIWFPGLAQRLPILKSWKFDLAIFLVIYLITAAAWNATPYPRHPDVVPPTPPHMQPYPIVDARVHDSGAISILNGYGINFKGYTDKPLYMAFLSVLHLLGGNDYWTIAFLQVCVLALIPPLLYLLGKSFHSRALGIFIAVVTLLRQRNAIILSHIIDSSNAKLLLTEVPTLLGISLFALLAFLWLRNWQHGAKPKLHLALLSGGIIGATSLIRLNPLLLFPAVGLVALLAIRKSIRVWFPQLALYTIGLLLIVLPWMISGTNPEGKPWLILKFLDVIHVRYIEPSSFNPVGQPIAFTTASGAQFRLSTGIEANLISAPAAFKHINDESSSFSEFPLFVVNHTLHNLVSSVLPLPDSIQYEDLNHLSQREYWQPENTWEGELPAAQMLLIFVNLALIAGGLGYGWVRWRWAGLLPAVLFLVYSLALGFARNSGARYTVPVDWVVFFYYGMGLILVMRLIRQLVKEDPAAAAPGERKPERAGSSSKRQLAFAFLFLILLGSVTPLAGHAIPEKENLLAAGLEAETLPQDAAQHVTEEVWANSLLMAGEVLYPHYRENHEVTFDLMTKNGLKTFRLDRNGLEREINQGQQVIVGYTIENDVEIPQFILTPTGTAVTLVWAPAP